MIRHQLIRRQQGAVLIVSLVLLLVITLIALASLSGSRLETKMVINQQDKQSTFQEAESGISQAMRNDKYYQVYQDSKVDDGCIVDADVDANSSADLAVTNCFRGRSIAVGEDINKFLFYHYQLDAKADSTAHNSSTNVVQGLRRLGPKID